MKALAFLGATSVQCKLFDNPYVESLVTEDVVVDRLLLSKAKMYRY